MMRVLIEYLVPLLLPVFLYWAWITFARRKNPDNPMAFFDGPWVWSVAAGIVLLVASLVFVALRGGHDPNSVYTPPHMENGHIVPGEFK